jgi:N-acetylglucosamine-6-phosphate deacetylase
MSTEPPDRADLLIRSARIPSAAGDRVVDIAIHDGVISTVQDADADEAASRTPATATVDADGALVSPGLIDIHLHGGFGATFGATDGDQLDRLTAGLAARGVTTVLASLVSEPTEQLTSKITALSAHLGPRSDHATIAGIHLEGPFLSRAQAGAHQPEVLRSPTAADLELITQHANVISMITLAPELPELDRLTELCTETGIVAAIGHSDGDQGDFDRAVASGASHVTHLWSGQSLVTRRGPWRVPGMLEASLASSLTAEIIADGKHLPPTLLEIARRCVGERLVVVSDATPGAGMPEGYTYRLGTVSCRVQDGVGMVEGQDAFGGSTTLVDEMLRYLVGELGWPVYQVLAMLTSSPATVLGRSDLGVIAPGARADLVLWTPELTADRVIIGGRVLADQIS